MGKWLSNQVNKFAESFVSIFETFALIGCIYVPIDFDFKTFFSRYLQESIPTPDNFVSIFLFSLGNLFIGIAFFVVLLLKIRRHNATCLFNRGHAYHDYPYLWYLYCAAFLGYKKCNLIHVPIYMQFKLVFRNTFDEYLLPDIPTSTKEADQVVAEWIVKAHEETEYNLILEDTYPIEDQEVLRVKPDIATLKISREFPANLNQYYSSNFIQHIISEVKQLPEGSTVNIFATTNPKHILEIVRKAFQTAGRGGISHLYVFQQKGVRQRTFDVKGHKIF